MKYKMGFYSVISGSQVFMHILSKMLFGWNCWEGQRPEDSAAFTDEPTAHSSLLLIAVSSSLARF